MMCPLCSYPGDTHIRSLQNSLPGSPRKVLRCRALLCQSQLAAAKQVEAELQASLAAAQKRSDAAQLMAQSLRGSLRAAEARLASYQQAARALTPPSAPASRASGEGSARAGAASRRASSSLAHDVARLTAQLAVAVREAGDAFHQRAELQEVGAAQGGGPGPIAHSACTRRAHGRCRPLLGNTDRAACCCCPLLSQAVRQRELDIQELQAQGAAHELMLQQVGSRGLEYSSMMFASRFPL